MPKIVDIAKRKTELARATLEVVARRGSLDVTVRDIAEAAGVSPALVSYYFPEKETLFAEALQLSSLRDLEIMREHQETGGTVREVLRAIIYSEVDQSGNIVLISFLGQALSNPPLRTQLITFDEQIVRGLSQLIQADQKKGLLAKDHQPEQLAKTLLVLLDGLSVRNALEPTVWTPKRQWELLEQFLLGKKQKPRKSS